MIITLTIIALFALCTVMLIDASADRPGGAGGGWAVVYYEYYDRTNQEFKQGTLQDISLKWLALRYNARRGFHIYSIY